MAFVYAMMLRYDAGVEIPRGRKEGRKEQVNEGEGWPREAQMRLEQAFAAWG